MPNNKQPIRFSGNVCLAFMITVMWVICGVIAYHTKGIAPLELAGVISTFAGAAYVILNWPQ